MLDISSRIPALSASKSDALGSPSAKIASFMKASKEGSKDGFHHHQKRRASSATPPSCP